MIQPSKEEFRDFAQRGNVVPVYIELLADCETPVSAYGKLRKDGSPSFLLESAEKTDQTGRFSIIGFDLTKEIRFRPGTVEYRNGYHQKTDAYQGDPLEYLEKFMKPFRPVPHGTLPPFFGGAVGFLSYESVTYFEPTVPRAAKDDLEMPDAVFFIPDKLLIFDHLRRTLKILINVFIPDDQADLEKLYGQAIAQIAQVRSRLAVQTPFGLAHIGGKPDIKLPVANMTRVEYLEMTTKMQEFIKAGDIFQVVPSQRFEIDFKTSPLSLYRVLRQINPSPYMFCVELGGDTALVGASPEVHVRCMDGKVEIRPIAGTRKRGKNAEEDIALEQELLADPKERAEHVMLIDLARNDVGRVCDFHSVKLTDFMIIERYSHVMHIVSHVLGKLHEGKTAYDVMRATFPAGTVSGSPKIRAMQIIAELEPTCRGIYAGAVGYFGFDGNLDSCIALRTVLIKNGKAYVQAGGGLVADSTPEGEYEESCNKAHAALTAIMIAKEIEL